MNKNIKHVARIQDIGAAAAAVAKEHKLISLDKTNKKRFLFIFEDTAELRATIQRYFSFSLQVDAQTIINALRSLKSQIYSDDIGFDSECERKEKHDLKAGKKKPAYVQALEEGHNFVSP